MGSQYDMSKPLGQRRPKILERMPEPPRPSKGDAFKIDEGKLRSALPPPEDTSPWYEGLKWVGAVLGLILWALIVVGLILWWLLGLIF